VPAVPWQYRSFPVTSAAPAEIKIGLIYGSVRQGRLCDKVADWTAGELARSGRFLVDAIDPRLIMMACWPEPIGVTDLDGLRHRIDRADAFVVVTPEYNHGYPSALKFLIDSASREWWAKPVAFVSYGGLSGGLRAVEQLRQVFAELHAVTVRHSVSLAHAWNRFDSSGALIAPEQPAKTMAAMLASLRWWATVLADARRTLPYEPQTA
jgi:NAD(P)H-dependent FMN reductase